MKYDVFETEWADAIALELQVAQIIDVQRRNGWKLDIPKTEELIRELDKIIGDIDAQLLPAIKPRVVRGSEVAAPFKKNGELSERARKWQADSGQHTISGPFTKLDFETINLGSPEQLKEYLYSIGWEPDEWNEDEVTGERKSPKLTTTSLNKLGKVGELIDHRMTCRHRQNQLRGFLRNVREDGRIEARANTIGTPTMRMTHSVVVNVPKADEDVFFGKKMRSCFTVKDGYALVGGDAAGLENRMIVHYLNNPDLIKVFTEGDFHMKWLNANKDFLSKRSVAKTSEYAFFFEAKDWKLGDIADLNPFGWNKERIGAQIRANVDNLIPGLNKLIKDTQLEAACGWIRGLDGRKVRVRRSPFNSKIQSAGAIFMKKVLVILDGWIKDLDAHFVGNFHDEFQLEVREDQAELVKFLFEQAIKAAEKHYNLKCPMEGVVKIGKRWSETH